MGLGLGSLDTNVLPLDAFELQGSEGDATRKIALKEPWVYDGESVSQVPLGTKWVTGRPYFEGDIVWNPTDKLTYIALVDNESVEPDYTDSAIEGVTWQWVAGTISGYVSGHGYWTRFADGALIQRGSASVTSGSSTVASWFGSASGTTYYVTQWITFPLEFVATPSITVNTGTQATARATSIATNQFALQTFNGGASTTWTSNWIAIGRWKE